MPENSPPIQVFTLGRFRLQRGGEAPVENGEGQRKPLELLKVLIALAGESVAEETITEALWPDSEGDAASSTFGATLHRLRRIAGPDGLRLRAGRLSLDPKHCWVDALEFPRRLALSAQAISRGDAAAAHATLLESLDLYRGPFLEGEFEPAEILAARQRLHSLFLRHVLDTGSWLAKHNGSEGALQLYRRGLEIDDLAEELYQRLMRASLDRGRIADGLALYGRCREILGARAGAQPSPETERLARELEGRRGGTRDLAAEATGTVRGEPARGAVELQQAATQPAPAEENSPAPPAPVGEPSKFHWRPWHAVAAAALISLLVTAWAFHRSGAPMGESASQPLPDIPSIAVMPFENLSGDPGQEYFSDGITVTLITDLSRLQNLFVIARDSTFTYKGKNVDARQVGRDLGVKYLLEGSVQRDGDRVRINAQLIDSASGSHLWGERFDQPAGDIFAIQDEIKRRIVARLDVNVGGEEARVWRRATTNPAAYDLFLQAQDAFYRVTEPSVARAIELFDQAIKLDSQFALAITLRGFAYQTQFYSGWARPREQSAQLAVAEAEKALRLDPQLIEAHTLLGVMYMHLGRLDEGLAELERAVTLNPNNAFASIFYSNALSNLGRGKVALPPAERAMRVNPFPPHWYLHVLGNAYSAAGDTDRAVETYEDCVRRLPDFQWCHKELAIQYARLGRIDEAKARLREVLRINPSFDMRQALSWQTPGAFQEAQRAALIQAGLPDQVLDLRR